MLDKGINLDDARCQSGWRGWPLSVLYIGPDSAKPKITSRGWNCENYCSPVLDSSPLVTLARLTWLWEDSRMIRTQCTTSLCGLVCKVGLERLTMIVFHHDPGEFDLQFYMSTDCVRQHKRPDSALRIRGIIQSIVTFIVELLAIIVQIVMRPS